MAASSSFSSAATRADRTGAVHHLGYRAAARHLADILAEIADGDAAIDRHLALVGQLLAGDHPEQRGLAGAIGADEPDLLALLERRGGLDEEDLMAVLLGDVVETDHVHACLEKNGSAALMPSCAPAKGCFGPPGPVLLHARGPPQASSPRLNRYRNISTALCDAVKTDASFGR